MKTFHKALAYLLVSSVLTSIPVYAQAPMHPLPAPDTHKPITKLEIKPVERVAEAEQVNIPSEPVAPAPAPPKAPTGNLASWMEQAGIPASDWDDLNYILGQESGLCATKWQGQFGYCPSGYTALYGESNGNVGYGLCQSTPAIKMASAGDDWRTNPVTQLRWCHSYFLQYGSISAAANFKRCVGHCWSPKINGYTNKATPWI